MGQAKKKQLLETETAKPVRKTNTEPSIRKQAIEAFFLHFYAHVHMTVMATKALGPAGFSLTKHRILGFATLTPGITVGELVRSLRVTHQNINEPLRWLIDEGYIVAKTGVEDRRHKRLFATRKGGRRFLRVLGEQVARLEDAFRATSPDAASTFLDVHRRLVEPSDREWIIRALQVAERDLGNG